MQVKSAKIEFLNILVIFQIIMMVVEQHHFKIHLIQINKHKRGNIDNTQGDRNTHTRFINEWKSYFKTYTNKQCNSIGVIFVDLYFFVHLFDITGTYHSLCTTLFYLYVTMANNKVFDDQYALQVTMPEITCRRLTSDSHIVDDDMLSDIANTIFDTIKNILSRIVDGLGDICKQVINDGKLKIMMF